MKKSLIIGAALMAAGIAIALAGFALSGGDVTALNAENGIFRMAVGHDDTINREERSYASDEFTAISFEGISDDVVVTASDDGLIHISLPQRERVHYDITEGKTLDIACSDRGGVRFGFNFVVADDEDVRISLPAGSQYDVEIDTVSGDLDVSRISAKALYIGTVSGDIKVRALSAETLDMETTSGDIDLTASAGAYRLSTTSGDVELHLPGDRDDYEIDVSTVSGECGMKDGGSGTKVSVDTVSGDIDFEFFGRSYAA